MRTQLKRFFIILVILQVKLATEDAGVDGDRRRGRGVRVERAARGRGGGTAALHTQGRLRERGSEIS